MAPIDAKPYDVPPDTEFDVPPASVCVRCGSAACDGCAGSPAEAHPAPIAWEAPGPVLDKLWSTVRASATKPEVVFGELGDGPILSACAFALYVELVALGSLAVLLLFAAWLLLPDFAGAAFDLIAADAALRWVVVTSVPALAGLMVLLHALWGLALELGASSAGAGWRPLRGLRFAFYSCGWDLLTSPAGLLFGLVSGGPVRAWQETIRAARVPRAAMHAYLSQARALSPNGSLRARRLVFAIMGPPILVGTGLAAWAAVAAVWNLA